MNKFFKVGKIVVDVDDGRLFDPIIGCMQLNFINMTMKSFGAKSKLIPIRFNEDKELLYWTSVKWIALSDTFPPDVIKAVRALIEIKVENELLG